MMKTVLVYHQEPWRDNLTTQLIKGGKDENGFYFIATQTIFRAQGGGQPKDEGTVSIEGKTWPIADVRNEEEIVKHYLMENAIPFFGLLKKGKEINLKINIEQRKINAKYHTAGHLLADLVELHYPELKGWKGNHFPGKGAVVFKIKDQKLEDVQKSHYGNYDLEKLKTNLNEWLKEWVQRNVKVTCYNEKFPREVVIDGFSACPCGGTHVEKLNDLGNVTVSKVKFKKGEGVKVSYQVGSI